MSAFRSGDTQNDVPGKSIGLCRFQFYRVSVNNDAGTNYAIINILVAIYQFRLTASS